MTNVQFVEWIGTAPGTSTMTLHGHNGGRYPCAPDARFPYMTPPIAWLRSAPLTPARAPATGSGYLDPYGTESRLEGFAGLGMSMTQRLGVGLAIMGVVVILSKGLPDLIRRRQARR